MLSCIILAGSLFLSDGEKLHSHDQVVTYSLYDNGRVLYLDQVHYADASIDIPRHLQGPSSLAVLEACIAEAEANT